jgi:hypothetical protein
LCLDGDSISRSVSTEQRIQTTAVLKWIRLHREAQVYIVVERDVTLTKLKPKLQLGRRSFAGVQGRGRGRGELAGTSGNAVELEDGKVVVCAATGDLGVDELAAAAARQRKIERAVEHGRAQKWRP